MNLSVAERRRRTHAGVGLALVGAGLSVAMDAGLRRASGASIGRWVGRGTIGLTLVGAGLSVFGEAVALRALQLTRESTDPATSKAKAEGE